MTHLNALSTPQLVLAALVLANLVVVVGLVLVFELTGTGFGDDQLLGPRTPGSLPFETMVAGRKNP